MVAKCTTLSLLPLSITPYIRSPHRLKTRVSLLLSLQIFNSLSLLPQCEQQAQLTLLDEESRACLQVALAEDRAASIVELRYNFPGADQVSKALLSVCLSGAELGVGGLVGDGLHWRKRGHMV